ncbi:hypothetical protein Pcinc_024631 [Petrolisthes cinctipes]|uniref:Uncharacterized protein n=1 Tax=Petrolisthes cinctipes TaxID=88211 RepID=A0AAE1KCP8_PETCI|nr:hypothetical protein Pcinc_024631 [Petrolisthes cinctipes]
MCTTTTTTTTTLYLTTMHHYHYHTLPDYLPPQPYTTSLPHPTRLPTTTTILHYHYHTLPDYLSPQPYTTTTTMHTLPDYQYYHRHNTPPLALIFSPPVLCGAADQ